MHRHTHNTHTNNYSIKWRTRLATNASQCNYALNSTRLALQVRAAVHREMHQTYDTKSVRNVALNNAMNAD